MTDQPEPLVRFERFSCWYDRSSAPVLRDLTLEIQHGEFVLLLGASGTGKTTLGLALNGIIPHVQGFVEGRVVVDGIDVGTSNVSTLASKVGMIFQDVESQLVMVNVIDEVAFGPENLMVPPDEVRARVREALDFVGIGELSDRFVFELSGGQKQKVAVASVLSMRPLIMFPDEPTANLDPRSSREVFDLIDRLRQDHTIVVFDNKIDDLASFASRVVVLGNGGVLFDGPPREVFEQHGEELLRTHGLWIPQASEIELELRRRGEHPSAVFPLSVDEAVTQYAGRARPSAVAPVPAPPAAPAVGDPYIQVEGLSHTYGESVAAISGLSFEIRRGERVAIVGPNGSGKTTLVKHFVGLLKPTAGAVHIGGRDTRRVSTHELAREIGFVFQYPEHQFVTDSVEAELGFSLRVAGMPESEIADRVHEQLRLFKLHGFEARHPYSLSGGEKRRLSVATMLIARPSALILDEPTYGQDRANTESMMASLFEASGEGGSELTLILVTHDMKLVATYAERAIVMRRGLVAFDGAVADLFRDGDLLSDANLEDPALFQIVRRLRAAGQPIPESIASVDNLCEALAGAPVATGHNGGAS
jgi:energy-coupling factor transport system ATP-binding protein